MRSRSSFRTRRGAAAAVASILLLASGAVVSLATPASATGPGGTVTAATYCNPDGYATQTITFATSFTGLIPHGPNAAYEDHVTFHGKSQDYETSDDTTYWYADDNGDHTGTGSISWSVPGDLGPGSGFSWELDHISGAVTEVASGTGAVADSHCKVQPTKPDKPSFGDTPQSIHVAKSGKFDVPFEATPATSCTITVMSGAKDLATAQFVVPANGRADPTMKLSKKDLKALKHKKAEDVKLTVSLHNSAGDAKGHTAATLKAPKH